MKKKKVLAFGEVMLRIALKNYQLIEQTKDARLNFTGTGLNVLSGVSHFGHKSTLLTQLPDNRLGLAAQAEIRKLGISDELIKSDGQHMGVYILEQGFGNRPSEVTYLDRVHSSFGTSKWASHELEAALDGVDMIHICGISLSLTEETRQAALSLAREGKRRGIQVCFDFNYRPSLNENNTLAFMRQQYGEILALADIVVGSSRDLFELLELDKEFDTDDFPTLGQHFLKKYDISYFVGTNRRRENETRYLQGFIMTPDELVHSKEYSLYIFDRVGTGDAYTAGIIVGILEEWPVAEIVEFATASGVLAHTTLGDSPLATKKQVNLFVENQQIDIVR